MGGKTKKNINFCNKKLKILIKSLWIQNKCLILHNNS